MVLKDQSQLIKGLVLLQKLEASSRSRTQSEERGQSVSVTCKCGP